MKLKFLTPTSARFASSPAMRMWAVIMLPGHAHNIINLEEDRDLVTVMWANEAFDPAYPDTFREEV